MFHVQVEIGLYVLSPTLENFNRPFMRLWFYAVFIQIEFELIVWSFHWNYKIKYLLRHSDVLLLFGSLEYVLIIASQLCNIN